MAVEASGYFNANTLARDLFGLVTGDRLGSGAAREVFRYALDESCVIKFEAGARSFQNVSEWETWTWVSNSPSLAKWFAPCLKISGCGSILLQRYVEPIRESERPQRLPAFLCDFKPENFGMLDGRIVARDYGTVHSAIRHADRTMKKVEWR